MSTRWRYVAALILTKLSVVQLLIINRNARDGLASQQKRERRMARVDAFTVTVTVNVGPKTSMFLETDNGILLEYCAWLCNLCNKSGLLKVFIQSQIAEKHVPSKTLHFPCCISFCCFCLSGVKEFFHIPIC